MQNVEGMQGLAADTKSCGSPLYPSPADGLRMPSGKHAGILIYYQTIVKEKKKKSALFLVITVKTRIQKISPLLTQMGGILNYSRIRIAIQVQKFVICISSNFKIICRSFFTDFKLDSLIR
jgi:hypothetical protein